jgi:thiosulfate/3-mercaptopyruvate sulfurtransferase
MLIRSEFVSAGLSMDFHTTVSTVVLAEHLNDSAWVVFDCRFSLSDTGAGERAYAEGHIPGARYAHLDRDLSSSITAGSGRHPLPRPADFAAWLGRCGVSDASQVVVYDDAGGAIAARLWWMLRWLGHERVAVLDGGLQAWLEEGRALSTKVPQPQPAVFEAAVEEGAWFDSVQVQGALADGAITLIDARGAERFRGEVEPIDPVAGHVPGACNRPYSANLGADGRFLRAAELRQQFDALLGATPAVEAVHMCGSGVTACHNLLAMELAGLSGSRVYVGSWSGWIDDPNRPVATGPD